MSDKTKAEWLREFADAMEADPKGWWKNYETTLDDIGVASWRVTASGNHERIHWESSGPGSTIDAAMRNPKEGVAIRRRTVTVTRYDRNGEPVELPLPLRKEPLYRADFWTIGPKGNVVSYQWNGAEIDTHLLENGICFASGVDAQAWAKYFSSLLEGNNDHD